MAGDTTKRRKLSAILMADVSGYSAMMGRDEERTTELIQSFHGRVRKTIEAHEGRVVDTAGDSVFGEFDSVVNAVRCAQQIHEGQDGANADVAPQERMETRIGVHLGDVIVEESSVYGDGVNIAARLEALAEPGGILISDAVYQLVRNKVDVPFVDLGLRELKNIEQPVHVYATPTRERASAPELVTRPLPPAPIATEQAGAPRPVSDSRSLSSPAPAPARAAPAETAVRRWVDEIIRAGVLVPVGIGFGLLLSGLVLPTGGIFPTLGAVLLGDRLGLVWARMTGRRAQHQIGLGIGIASGALLTRWSGVTDALFLMGGAITILTAISGGPSRREAKSEEREAKSEQRGPKHQRRGRRGRRRRKRVPADPRRR